ncbi:unnamed protein product [Caenorhabditis auriculariae]|uniref:Receptor ligand binding region domain-containing protein n=1 Tax=Caenorhabditis auriculariae TaxID=2777116 RepID=A0A8S1GST5_9PELO|nr:unnamed protein product [Caenorhabditis auriculariae]
MLRLAELSFNARTDIDFDVLLGTRDLPPMERATVLWNLNRIVCDEMKLGYMIMLAGTNSLNFGVYEAISDSMKVPLIDWEMSNKRPSGKRSSLMTYSVRPPIDQLLVDYIMYKGWRNIVYIHDGANDFIEYET